MTVTPYQSASELIAQLQRGALSSVDLLDYYLGRLDRLNPALNAVIATDREAARSRAEAADAATARGERWGPLHGLPMTIKDTYEVPGMATTAGAPMFANHMATEYAEAVQALVNAGAIVYGKTNVPLFAGDVQTFNEVYGTTNNPWDNSRTPGGSSGGAAAALAADLTAVELGSDIGGSIRTPAHYCGLFGHKPTHGVVSLKGHIPGPPGTAAEPDLAVGGPLTRSAADLTLMMQLLSAGRSTRASGWNVQLPEPSFSSLDGLRVAAWFDDADCTLDADLRTHYRTLVERLKESGASVTEGPPAGLSIDEVTRIYLPLLASIIGADIPTKDRSVVRVLSKVLAIQERLDRAPSKYGSTFTHGISLPHREWLKLDEQREKLAARVADWFQDYDVLVSPITPTTAPTHNQEGEVFQRTIDINGASRSYADQLLWIGLATVLGLPGTSAPTGLVNGLPANVQVIGPRFSDYTTIAAAGHISTAMGGFVAPPACI